MRMTMARMFGHENPGSRISEGGTVGDWETKTIRKRVRPPVSWARILRRFYSTSRKVLHWCTTKRQTRMGQKGRCMPTTGSRFALSEEILQTFDKNGHLDEMPFIGHALTLDGPNPGRSQCANKCLVGLK